MRVTILYQNFVPVLIAREIQETQSNLRSPFRRASERRQPAFAASKSTGGLCQYGRLESAKKSGTGIVWSTLTTGKSADHGNAAGVLRAFSAETLEELWNSEASPKRDRLGTLVKFVPPLVVEGRVYVPNYDNAVVVYGILHD